MLVGRLQAGTLGGQAGRVGGVGVAGADLELLVGLGVRLEVLDLEAEIRTIGTRLAALAMDIL